jgi:hypothetical protein
VQSRPSTANGFHGRIWDRPHRSRVGRAVAPLVVFIATFVVSQVSSALDVTPSICLMQALLGLPCPGCGVTTSVLLLLRGGLTEALQANSAAPVVMAFAAAQLVITVVAARGRMPTGVVATLSRANDRALIAALLANWIMRISEEILHGTSVLS